MGIIFLQREIDYKENTIYVIKKFMNMEIATKFQAINFRGTNHRSIGYGHLYSIVQTLIREAMASQHACP